MTNPNYDFSKAKEDKLTKPRDLAWDNWAKFEKIGDSVQGFIRDVFFREAEGDFKEQRGITLEQPDGTFINVGIKHIDFVLAKTDGLRLGDPLTIELEKETPNQTKGYSAVKVFGFYGKNLPETEGQPTVKELEALDRGEVAEAKAKADAEFNGEPAAGVAEATPTAADVPFPSPSDTPAPVAGATTAGPVIPAPTTADEAPKPEAAG